MRQTYRFLSNPEKSEPECCARKGNFVAFGNDSEHVILDNCSSPIAELNIYFGRASAAVVYKKEQTDSSTCTKPCA